MIADSLPPVLALRVAFCATESQRLPPFLGSALHGTLGGALYRTVCAFPRREGCNDCPLARRAYEERALSPEEARALLYTVGLVGRDNERIDALFASGGVSRKELERVRCGLQSPMGCKKLGEHLPGLCDGCAAPVPAPGGYATPALLALREAPTARRATPPWLVPTDVGADPGDASSVEMQERLARLERALEGLLRELRET